LGTFWVVTTKLNKNNYVVWLSFEKSKDDTKNYKKELGGKKL
jgi:hypothetical protein